MNLFTLLSESVPFIDGKFWSEINEFVGAYERRSPLTGLAFEAISGRFSAPDIIESFPNPTSFLRDLVL